MEDTDPGASIRMVANRTGQPKAHARSFEMLIKSKTTCREQDRTHLVRLRDLLELNRQCGDAAN